MSTYGTAVIADTATCEEAEAITANLRKLAAMTVDRCTLNPVAPVGELWRASGYIAMSTSEMIGIDLFAGVDTARVVIADDIDEYGALWTAWRVHNAEPVVVYRKYLAANENAVDTELAAKDRADIDAAADMAELWGVNPTVVTTVEDHFGAMSRSLGIVGTPFLPWLDALDLRWPIP